MAPVRQRMSDRAFGRSLRRPGVQGFIGTVVLSGLAWYAAFTLPFHFPPRQRLWSASYAFGFNNSVAILALFALLGIASFCQACRGTSSTPIFDLKSNRSESRTLWLAFVFVSMLYGIATVGMYVYQVTAAPWLMWEVRHLNYRTLLMDIYRLHPYSDFSAEYGPLLTYLPFWLYHLLGPFGGSYEAAYFAAHFFLNVAGLWCAVYVLSQARISDRRRIVILVVIAVSGFAPYMGINGVLVRYLFPFAALLIAWRAIAWCDSIVTGGRRRLAMSAVISGLLTATLLLSAEIALAFTVAWLSYCLFVCRRRPGLLIQSLLCIVLVAAVCVLLLPTAYYATLFHFSQGANNLPLLPAPHLIFYLMTMLLLVPLLVSAGLRARFGDSSAAFSSACGVLCLAMAPGALGRCDPPHVLFYGMGASMLLMILLSARWSRMMPVYVAGYCLVFIAWMQLVHLKVFYKVPPQSLLSKRGIVSMIRKIRHSAASEAPNNAARSNLEHYARIGLPFATYGDPALENYIVRHGQLQPDYFISMVGIYTSADLQRKFNDLDGMQYIVVPAGFGTHAPHDACAEFRQRLEEWFLRSAELPCRHPDVLDPPGAIDSFISDHYRVVENIGSSVLMRRIPSP